MIAPVLGSPRVLVHYRMRSLVFCCGMYYVQQPFNILGRIGDGK